MSAIIAQILMSLYLIDIEAWNSSNISVCVKTYNLFSLKIKLWDIL